MEKSNMEAAREPAIDTNDFVVVPTLHPETQIPKQTPTQTMQSQKQRKSVHWSPDLVTESPSADDIPDSESSSISFKEKTDVVKDVLRRWGKKMEEATRKAEDLAGNTWQHLKTNPSFTEAAMGRIAQGTKVLAEGGYYRVFRQTFETTPEEQLQNSFACYLSTTAGPVMGVLYVSTIKLAYCSDNPLSFENVSQAEWNYYKVVLPLHQLREINSSTSKVNPAEKYIQVISVDSQEFWFMGFLNYNGIVTCLQEASQLHCIRFM